MSSMYSVVVECLGLRPCCMIKSETSCLILLWIIFSRQLAVTDCNDIR